MRFKDKVGVYLLSTRNQALTLAKKVPLNGILPAKQKLLMSVTVAAGVVAIYSLLYWVDWAGFGPDSNKSIYRLFHLHLRLQKRLWNLILLFNIFWY